MVAVDDGNRGWRSRSPAANRNRRSAVAITNSGRKSLSRLRSTIGVGKRGLKSRLGIRVRGRKTASGLGLRIRVRVEIWGYGLLGMDMPCNRHGRAANAHVLRCAAKTALEKAGEARLHAVPANADNGRLPRLVLQFAGNRCGLRGRMLCDSCTAETFYHVPLTACRAASSLAPRALRRGPPAIDSPARAQPAEKEFCCRFLHAPLQKTLLLHIPLQMYGKAGRVKLGERKRPRRVATDVGVACAHDCLACRGSNGMRRRR